MTDTRAQNAGGADGELVGAASSASADVGYASSLGADMTGTTSGGAVADASGAAMGDDAGAGTTVPQPAGLGERLAQVVANIGSAVVSVAYPGLTTQQATMVPSACLALAAVGAAFACSRCSRQHGLRLATVGLGEMFVVLLLVAHALGLPAIMDQNRTGCFLVALMPLVPALLVDAPCAALATFARGGSGRMGCRICSLALALAVGAGTVAQAGIAAPFQPVTLEYNGSVTTLTSILRDFPDRTWTIVSAGDELRMCEAYGYHTESVDLLDASEYRLERDEDGDVTGLDSTLDFVIPTERVFFFVEKYVNYRGQAGNVTGDWCSEAYAAGALPDSSAFSSRAGAQAQVAARQTVQSRMLYWVDELRRRYPRETSVYYEDDKLLVVELDQPESNWVNLAFPYGYNDRTIRAQLAEMGFDDGMADGLLASAGDGGAGATRAGDDA